MRTWILMFCVACSATDPTPADSGGADAADEGTFDTFAPQVDPDHGEAPAERLALPTFKAWNEEGVEVGPDQLRGQPTVMWFYPAAGTSGCTVEGCGYRDLHDAFEALGIQIVGVSFDAPSDNAEWSARESFPFSLWTDTDRTLAQHYGAASSPSQAVARRVTKILDAEGVLVWEYPAVSVGTHPDEVLEDCRTLFSR